jgi:DNA-binding transcriptional MerR regulator
MPYTVKQVSDYLNVSPATIRAVWSVQFAAHLSPEATPGKGQPRRFTEADIATLYTVAAMRRAGRPLEDIHATLDAGERLEPPPGSPQQPQGDGPGQQQPPGDAVAVAGFTAALVAYENRVTSLENELKEERAARLDAEIRAARLSGEIDALRATPPPPPAPATLGDALRQWFNGRRQTSPK